MSTRRNYPRSNTVYTLAEVYQLDLKDSPSLGFYVSRRHVMAQFGVDFPGMQPMPSVIQDSHVSVNLSDISPEWAALRFRYLRTTQEWIPVFQAIDDDAVVALCDVVYVYDVLINHYGTQVTPKGHPRDCMDHLTTKEYARNYANGGDDYALFAWGRDLRCDSRGFECYNPFDVRGSMEAA